jgi:hypothetical protein
MSGFNESWNERYALGGHPNAVLFIFLQSVIITWKPHESPEICMIASKVVPVLVLKQYAMKAYGRVDPGSSWK